MDARLWVRRVMALPHGFYGGVFPMKRSRRLFSAFLTLCLVFTLLPLPARAATEFEYVESGLMWKVNDGVLTLAVSNTPGDRKLEGARSPWTSDASKIRSAVIEEGVKGICDNSFANHMYMASISLPSTLEEIGERAFDNTAALSEITVAAGNTHYCAEDNVLYALSGGKKRKLYELLKIHFHGEPIPYQIL